MTRPEGGLRRNAMSHAARELGAHSPEWQVAEDAASSLTDSHALSLRSVAPCSLHVKRRCGDAN